MRKVTESQIDGDFEGWDGDKKYKLLDGTEWELTSYAYNYQYSYMPRAIVWEDGGSYYLEVDGMDEKMQVRRA